VIAGKWIRFPGNLIQTPIIFYQNKLLMLIIDVKENESIDRALKRYKRKHRDAKVMQQIRQKQHYTKPSIERRKQVLKAVYKLKKQQQAE